MTTNNNSKGSPSSTAIGRYLAGVRDLIEQDTKDDEVKKLVSNLSSTDRKRLPKDFVEKLTSFSDATIQAATSHLPAYVSEKIRELATKRRYATTETAAKIKGRRETMGARSGLLSKSRGDLNKRISQPFLKLSADPAYNNALRIKYALEAMKQQQKAPMVSSETEGAAITPEATAKVG
tara:strand:- start:1421 stop:1957 length:537 start_codon:yes stop_codon:yes gene_type:complete